MLAKRIIPCLDVRGGRVVKGTKFIDIVDAGDPVELAKSYNDQGADELVFLDIDASHEGRETIVDVAARTAESVFIPFTVGGGIRSVDDFRRLLRAGADKVSVNSAAVRDPNLIREAALVFGSQCVVVAIDARRVEGSSPQSWEVVINGGRVPTGIDVIEWVEKCQDLGAGEFLVTSMDADGTKGGYDNSLNAAIAAVSRVPLVASGGAGSPEDLADAVTIGKADAVLAASIFHFGEYTVADVKEHFASRGIPTRTEESY